MGSIRTYLAKLLGSDYFVLILTVTYFSVMATIIPELASGANLKNLLTYIWPLLILVIGQTMVMIVAGIDLSQTAIMGLTSVVGAALMTQAVEPAIFQYTPLWGMVLSDSGGLLQGVQGAVVTASILMVLLGALMGTLNGLAVAFLKIPAFMVTLVTQVLFAAVAVWLTKSEKISALPDSFLNIKQPLAEQIPSLSPMLLITLSVMLILHLLLSRGVLGRNMYATGANQKSAQVSGVRVAKTLVVAYMLSGACAGIAGVLLSSWQETGSPTLGAGMLLDIVGAAVIGGVSLFGGKGKIIGAFFGVVFFVILDNTLNLLNLNSYTVMMVKGAVILLAASLDVMRGSLKGVRA